MEIFNWLKCLFLHDWLYCSPEPVNSVWHRCCNRCHEKQEQKNGKWVKGWNK